ncbi:MAG TPA: hypothetical protein VF881_12040 [Polyangiaceae bacterium]
MGPDEQRDVFILAEFHGLDMSLYSAGWATCANGGVPQCRSIALQK